MSPREECHEMKKRSKHIGSSLDDFLKEEGVLEQTRAVALKETLQTLTRAAHAIGRDLRIELV